MTITGSASTHVRDCIPLLYLPLQAGDHSVRDPVSGSVRGMIEEQPPTGRRNPFSAETAFPPTGNPTARMGGTLFANCGVFNKTGGPPLVEGWSVLPVPTTPGRPFPSVAVSESRNRSRRSRPRGYVRISGIGHARAHTHDNARRFNPLAHGLPTCADANFLIRQCCARVRTPHIGSVAPVLTATVTPEPGHRASKSRTTSTEPLVHRPRELGSPSILSCYAQSTRFDTTPLRPRLTGQDRKLRSLGGVHQWPSEADSTSGWDMRHGSGHQSALRARGRVRLRRWRRAAAFRRSRAPQSRLRARYLGSSSTCEKYSPQASCAPISHASNAFEPSPC